MCATEEYFCSVNVLFLVLRHSFRYFRSWEDTDLPQVQNGEVTHVRSQCYLFFYHEPLKEKGAGADIKKHTTTRKQHSPLPKLGKSFKRADPLFAFPSTGHLPNVHKGNCVTRHGLAARFSKGDLLELSLILEAVFVFFNTEGSTNKNTRQRGRYYWLMSAFISEWSYSRTIFAWKL